MKIKLITYLIILSFFINFSYAQASSICPDLKYFQTRGTNDKKTERETSKLQLFLKQNLLLSNNQFIVTGTFGSITENFVKIFQSRNGLVVSGLVGPATRNKILHICDTVDQSEQVSGKNTCTSLPDQTQTISCAVGQSGMITQLRKSICSLGGANPIWGDWVTTQNTCITTVNTTGNSGSTQCVVNGVSIADNSSQVFYENSNVNYPKSCVSEIRTCNNGNLSGSFVNTSCSVTNNNSTMDINSYNKTVSSMMFKIKTAGCMADSLLSGNNGAVDSDIQMLNRSNCQSASRAIETWGMPPDFNQIKANMDKLTKPDLIIGINISEQISTDKSYWYPNENRNFNFKEMCKPGSMNQWGPNTCVPTYTSMEYQKYVTYIGKKAIDIGVKDFMFGQYYYVDDLNNPVLPKVVSELKEYARLNGKVIVTGVQPNDHADSSYNKSFDYISGGLGQDENGNFDEESSVTCSKKFSPIIGGCWALDWKAPYSTSANNVLISLDWFSDSRDDINTFAKMTSEAKKNFLLHARDYLKSYGAGFLFPFRAILNPTSGACTGPQSDVYSANNSYNCKDEDIENQIISGSISSPSAFISQSIPTTMSAGQTYPITLTFKNNSSNTWSSDLGFKLGSQDPQDNRMWGTNRIELPNSVPPNSSAVFTTTVKAPVTPGTYNMQWKMLQEGVTWFGDYSTNLRVTVQ